MKHQWSSYELEESWSLSPEELVLLSGRSDSNHLGFAVLLKFFQITGYFPRERADVPQQAVEHLANLVNLHASDFNDHSFSDRLLKSHRAEIRSFLGFRPSTNKDARAALQWLKKEALSERSTLHLQECLRRWYLDCRIEQPSHSRKTLIPSDLVVTF